MIEARAYWLAWPGHGEVRAERVAPPGEGEVLVEALASGVSRGTETLVFRGEVPASQQSAMRCPFQGGQFPAPVKYGYSVVGRVVGGPHHGRRVFCLHPHQDRFVVPVAHAIAVPEAVPDSRATLAANVETAVNALWDAGPRVGDRIAVVGAGVVGACIAMLAARLPGAEVQLIDVDANKESLAVPLGVGFATPETAAHDVDLVVHASGNPSGLATALRLAGFEATVLEVSWYGTRAVTVPLGEAFHHRRLRLVASQVGAVAPPRRARWCPRRRLELALRLLADSRFDAMLAPPVTLDDLPQAMATLAVGPSSVMCQVVTYT